MGASNLTAKEVTFSLDIGTRSVIGTVGVLRDKKFHVIAEKYTEHEERAMVDGQIHDIGLVAKAVNKGKNLVRRRTSIKIRKSGYSCSRKVFKNYCGKIRNRY